MSGEAAAPAVRRTIDLRLRPAWLLVAGLLAMAVPTGTTLARESWGSDTGAHGPIVLLTGAWLLWRLWPTFKAEGAPGAAWVTGLMLAFALPVYVFGRAYDFLLLEAAGLYVAGVAALQARFGLPILARNWFPFVYLAFAIPLPGYLLDRFTTPVREMISTVVTHGLHAAGLPIGRQGVTLMVGPYQLLVEDACSGLNSLIGLTAVSLFYIHLMHQASWRYALFLAAFVIPIAILANLIRVSALVLLTYYFGDAVGQGFMHEGTGLFLFATALLLVFAFDALCRPLWARAAARRSAATGGRA